MRELVQTIGARIIGRQGKASDVKILVFQEFHRERIILSDKTFFVPGLKHLETEDGIPVNRVSDTEYEILSHPPERATHLYHTLHPYPNA